MQSRSFGASITMWSSITWDTPRSGTLSTSMGVFEARNCRVAYKENRRILALATISRDLESLKAEAASDRS